MFCAYCGKQVDERAVFCSHCGQRTAPAPRPLVASVAQPEKAKQTSNLRIVAALLISLLLLSIIAIYDSTQEPTQNKSSVTPAAPVPAKPPSPPAARTPKEEKQWENRNLDRAALEKTFLQSGVDVVVGNLVSQGSDDNRSLFIKGETVNRPFVYNFLDRDAVRLLKKDGFIKVTFMRNSMGDWVAEYDVQTGTITWD